ncbi:Uracil permease [Taphrina deformans PYCC 5710]|uniref:Uracil permease n=1 Tax=Taphrina deformans (strain PYCC 5710 / ATCC 11124 / CBS 356.35 / IMI 108563 / JCM 9778 / NBRC 8474) TaxID=1097556 RepID=R4XBF0_TAPDE|nr:Uracil permease [Taphrina deformans PYCC 5710]|eukprot:CCG83184.1 Uracil permease [Taphrina deformans PYCC 5710]
MLKSPSNVQVILIAKFIGFVLFSLLTCCFLWVRPEKTAKMLLVMNCISFASLLGIAIWAIKAAHGLGSLLSAGPKVRGSYKTGWAIVQSVSCVVGAIAVGLSNQADFSRFAYKLGDQVAGQLFSIPVFGILVPLLGCITASATGRIYGEVIWNPPVLVNKWLEMDYTAASRISAVFTGSVSQIGINLIDNAYAGGMDLAGLLPRWINIRRGAYLTLIASVLFQPWQLLSSASVFLNVLSAYSVVLGPLTGIMMTDYWFVRRRKLKLSHLYRADSTSIYWFWHGINARAFLAWTIGFVPLLPGYINHINPDIHVPEAMKNLYNLAFPLGLLSSSLSFYILCRVWPPQGLGQVDDTDVFDTFTDAEANRLGIATCHSLNNLDVIKTEKTPKSTVERLELNN